MGQTTDHSTPTAQDATRGLRVRFIEHLRAHKLVPADHRGVRVTNPAAAPNIGILREATPTRVQKFLADLPLIGRCFPLPPADWIGTAYFPRGEDESLVIEVYGKRNMDQAGPLAWRFKCETGIDCFARVASGKCRTEMPDVIHTANVDNWGAFP